MKTIPANLTPKQAAEKIKEIPMQIQNGWNEFLNINNTTMPKRFDCEEEPNEFMEAPCRCNCGMWFDQMDGYRVGATLVCRECKEAAEEENED